MNETPEDELTDKQLDQRYTDIQDAIHNAFLSFFDTLVMIMRDNVCENLNNPEIHQYSGGFIASEQLRLESYDELLCLWKGLQGMKRIITDTQRAEGKRIRNYLGY